MTCPLGTKTVLWQMSCQTGKQVSTIYILDWNYVLTVHDLSAMSTVSAITGLDVRSAPVASIIEILTEVLPYKDDDAW